VYRSFSSIEDFEKEIADLRRSVAGEAADGADRD
jgi:transcriptional repressor NrdR